jgi:hypothetical protein
MTVTKILSHQSYVLLHGLMLCIISGFTVSVATATPAPPDPVFSVITRCTKGRGAAFLRLEVSSKGKMFPSCDLRRLHLPFFVEGTLIKGMGLVS